MSVPDLNFYPEYMENQNQSNGLINELITDLKRVLNTHNDRTIDFVKSEKNTILSEIAFYGSVQKYKFSFERCQKYGMLFAKPN